MVQKSICIQCGKEFDQYVLEQGSIYSSFRTCTDCRKQKEKDRLKSTKTTKFPIPFEPFPAQQEILKAFENHRFVVVAAGSRFGIKTCSIMATIKYFAECLNENRHIHNPDLLPSVDWQILAPTKRSAQTYWKMLKSYIPKEWLCHCDDTDFWIQTIGKGVIKLDIGDDYSPPYLGYDLCTIIEAERFKDLVGIWNDISTCLNTPYRGREQDRLKADKFGGQGKAFITCAHINDNGLYHLWERTQKDNPRYDHNWWYGQYAWKDNPINAKYAKGIVHTKYGDMTREDMLRHQVGEKAYRSNYLAEFISE